MNSITVPLLKIWTQTRPLKFGIPWSSMSLICHTATLCHYMSVYWNCSFTSVIHGMECIQHRWISVFCFIPSLLFIPRYGILTFSLHISFSPLFQNNGIVKIRKKRKKQYKLTFTSQWTKLIQQKDIITSWCEINLNVTLHSNGNLSDFSQISQ
jgi:hypothetical protein